MYTTEATTNGRLEKLLRCPRCKTAFKWESDLVTCNNCAASYKIQSSSLPVYELYVDDRPDEAGRDPTQVWRRDDFELNFKTIGYHESGVQFDQQLGYPEEVSLFLFERVKKRLLEWVQPDAGHSILDVGCGAGYFLYLIHAKYKANGFTPTMVGIDSSTFQLSYMIQRMQKEGISDTISVHANSEYLPFADESFDVVTCSEVLEHIRNPLRALAEMHRVLKPGGRLLLSTPSMTAQKGWGTVLAPLSMAVKALRHYKPKPDTTHGGYDLPWYAKELRQAIRTAKFEINNFEYNAVIPHPWHFKFCPKALVKPVVAGFELADRYLKFFLKPLALHFVLRASKRVGD